MEGTVFGFLFWLLKKHRKIRVIHNFETFLFVSLYTHVYLEIYIYMYVFEYVIF